MWSRRWWTLAFALVAALAGFAFEARRPEVFRAEATVELTTATTGQGGSTQQEVVFVARRFAELADTDGVLTPAADALGMSADELRDHTSASAGGTLGFVTVSATASDADDAVARANALAESLVTVESDRLTATSEAQIAPLREEIAALENQLTELPADAPSRPSIESQLSALHQAVAERRVRPDNQVRIVETARTQDSPVEPRPLVVGALAGVVALVVGAECSVLLDKRRGRRLTRRRAAWFSQHNDLPVLEVALRQDRDPFRLASTLWLLQSTLVGRRGYDDPWVVTSTDDVDLTQRVAVGLAAATVQSGVGCTVVDANLESGTVPLLLGIDPRTGLSDNILEHISDLGDLPSAVGAPQLSVVPRGTQGDAGWTAIGAGRLSAGLEKLQQLGCTKMNADVFSIVVTTPQLSADAGASLRLLSELNRTVVLVLDKRSATEARLNDALELLNAVDAHLGAVCIVRRSARGR